MSTPRLSSSQHVAAYLSRASQGFAMAESLAASKPLSSQNASLTASPENYRFSSAFNASFARLGDLQTSPGLFSNSVVSSQERLVMSQELQQQQDSLWQIAASFAPDSPASIALQTRIAAILTLDKTLDSAAYVADAIEGVRGASQARSSQIASTMSQYATQAPQSAYMLNTLDAQRANVVEQQIQVIDQMGRLALAAVNRDPASSENIASL